MMTLRTLTIEAARVGVWQRLMDYLALMKPRMVLMILAVTMAGFYMGALGTPEWTRLLHLLVGVALTAGGTLALNQYIERQEDALMPRTQSRPLPDGRVQPLSAWWLGVVVTSVGLLYLVLTVHIFAVLVTALTTVSYLFWYTPLKRKTSLCSFVGAIPGALPPVTGWVAARGAFTSEVWVLFAILFLWQLPHSLAIAWLYREEYARAGFRLLPVLYPDGHSTARQIVTNSLALLAVGLLPTLIGLTGPFYFVAMLILGLGFLGFGVHVALARTAAAARRLLLVSLIYLPLAFLLMVLDKIPTP
jgi:protoheme IX farnesyltransferase